jgi:RNA polymerase sigma factor (sigma-70 family)
LAPWRADNALTLLTMHSAGHEGQAPPSGDAFQVVEHLFRHEAAKMVAILTRIFGPEHLTLAEDVVQEALVKALERWPFYGIPENPSAWILRASRNLALDVVRRQKLFRDKEAQIALLTEQPSPAPDVVFPEEEIGDDRLRLMFVCCHPLIPAEVQAALALKTLCGFGITEISRAFLTSEAAVAKRLTRAKQRIREAKIPFEIPAGEELKQRLEGVLRTLYLLFNEGYKASIGERLVREEVYQEAIRLTSLLASHPVGDQPKTHALLALMLLNAARTHARVDAAGNLLLLDEQDRTRWDASLIAQGMYHFARSGDGRDISSYHIQAAIAVCHCTAKDSQSTDWRQILSLYDRLSQIDGSPVVALNRAVAVAKVHGPDAGIDAVQAIRDRGQLDSYYLFHAVLGEFEARRADLDAAAGHFRRSLALARTQSERALLSKRIQVCQGAVDHACSMHGDNNHLSDD